MDECNKKILEYKEIDLYIVFYSSWCKPSQDALSLLKNNNLSYKAYEIDDIKGGKERLL